MEGYILPERKAYVNWFNDEFYRRIVKQRKGKDQMVFVYQELLKEYLNVNTPYRGALIFHGLGTGKTATAITITEGIGSDWEIVTILPASLESNFKEEVKSFGDSMFRIYRNSDTTWIYKAWKKLSKEETAMLKDYGITESFAEGLKKKAYGDRKIRVGIFMESEKGKGQKYDELEKEEQVHLNAQLTAMIEAKYHFMGYKPFIDFKKVNKKYTGGKEQLHFYKRMMLDVDRYSTPFNNKVVIIDEVHGFISNVVNRLGDKDLKRASLVYSWLMKADKCKLICLSGTPVVNTPNELAVMVNMLKGMQTVYTFEMPMMSEEEYMDLLGYLKTLFTTNSPIKQYLVNKTVYGKITISVVRNIPNFVSVLGKDGTVMTVPGKNDIPEKDFLFKLYDTIQEKYKQLEPNKQDIQESIKKRTMTNFFKELPTFTIIDNEGKLKDCTKNDIFMDMFVNSNYEIKKDKRDLLIRMCAGCVSYYPSSDDVKSDDMAVKNERQQQYIMEGYENYKILQYINVIDCPLTPIQFEAYEQERLKETKIMKTTRNAKVMYNYETNRAEKNSSNSYHVKSIMLGTIAYDKDNSVTNVLNDDELLVQYSPKFFNLIQQLKSSGQKSLIYSRFKQNAGLYNIEVLLKRENIQYRKVTGDESKKLKQDNINEYNNDPNIQVMLISEAGAQGISLEKVREVHIIEPYWNFTRLEQVIGRAIRKKSHEGLSESEKNVSIFMYISSFPSRKDINELSEDELSEQDKKSLIMRVSNLKLTDNNKTMDQYLMSIMEAKYKITDSCKNILISSSMDCQQHGSKVQGVTCLDYTKMEFDEDMYFPGMNNLDMKLLDPKQIRKKGVVKGKYTIVDAYDGSNSAKKQKYILYYKDAREPMAIISYDTGRTYLETTKCFNDPPRNFECLGDIIEIPDELYDTLEETKPSYEDLLKISKADTIIGYKVRHNSGEVYFSTVNLSNDIEDRQAINRLYEWKEFKKIGFDISGLQAYTYKNKKIYKVN